eukprot:5995818-Pyramimonas_sp.AAC.1
MSPGPLLARAVVLPRPPGSPPARSAGSWSRAKAPADHLLRPPKHGRRLQRSCSSQELRAEQAAAPRTTRALRDCPQSPPLASAPQLRPSQSPAPGDQSRPPS